MVLNAPTYVYNRSFYIELIVNFILPLEAILPIEYVYKPTSPAFIDAFCKSPYAIP